jgi:hypothetical protein
MPYDREQWEEVSFQVFEDMGGTIRSGYYPTGEGLVDGNVAIDFTFGTFPIQPDEDRAGMFLSQKLGVLDSHKIAATEWNAYPIKNGPTAGSRNYKVTAVKYLGSDDYEYTSQNNLQVGDFVTITGCNDLTKDFNANNREVTYADATKFRISDELSTGELTGLYYGRVDVVNEPWTGMVLENGEEYYAPRVGVFNDASLEEAKVTNYFDYLRSMGVNPNFFKDATFSGEVENEWDESGTYNEDGCVLYSYIPADVYIYDDPQGVPVYGSDLDGVIAASLAFDAGDILSADGMAEDYMVVVFSNDSRKNNAGWW